MAYNRSDKDFRGDSTDIVFTAFDVTGRHSYTFTESDVEDLKRENIIEVRVGPETGLIHASLQELLALEVWSFQDQS